MFLTEGTLPKLTKRLVLDTSAIAELKAKATKDGNVPLRVAAVIAFLWKCLISMAPEKLILLNIPVNLRGRIDPPLPDHSLGNITKGVNVATANDDDIELHLLASQLKAGFTYINDEFARNQELYDSCAIGFRPMPESSRQKQIAVWTISSWCRFPFYEVDFGWGRPIWVCSTFGFVGRKLILLDTIDGAGVEALVFLEEQDMLSFEKSLKSFMSPTSLVEEQQLN